MLTISGICSNVNCRMLFNPKLLCIWRADSSEPSLSTNVDHCELNELDFNNKVPVPSLVSDGTLIWSGRASLQLCCGDPDNGSVTASGQASHLWECRVPFSTRNMGFSPRQQPLGPLLLSTTGPRSPNPGSNNTLAPHRHQEPRYSTATLPSPLPIFVLLTSNLVTLARERLMGLVPSWGCCTNPVSVCQGKI